MTLALKDKEFKKEFELLTNVILPKIYHIFMCEDSVEHDKMNILCSLIMSAKREEEKIPVFSGFDVVILPIKDICFTVDKEYGSLFIHTIYGHIESLDYPGDVFKYIRASIYLKMNGNCDIRTITNMMIDVMIYCIINNIEINLIDLIKLDWNKKFTKKPYDNQWYDTKNNFKKAIPDGYMKDILLKAIKQEKYSQVVQYTYSIVDIVEKLRLN